MESVKTILALVAVIAFAQAHGRSEADYENKNIVNFTQVGPVAANSFSWKDCGNGAAGSISKLSLTPDPLKYPGTLTASFEAALSRDVNGPLKTKVLMQKLRGTNYVRLPCFNKMGSCNYDDICPLLEQVTCNTEDASNLDCHCPFKKGTYSLAPAAFPFKVDQVPAFLVRGDYKFEVNMSDNVGQVMCLQGHFVIA